MDGFLEKLINWYLKKLFDYVLGFSTVKSENSAHIATTFVIKLGLCYVDINFILVLINKVEFAKMYLKVSSSSYGVMIHFLTLWDPSKH